MKFLWKFSVSLFSISTLFAGTTVVSSSPGFNGAASGSITNLNLLSTCLDPQTNMEFQDSIRKFYGNLDFLGIKQLIEQKLLPILTNIQTVMSSDPSAESTIQNMSEQYYKNSIGQNLPPEKLSALQKNLKNIVSSNSFSAAQIKNNLIDPLAFLQLVQTGQTQVSVINLEQVIRTFLGNVDDYVRKISIYRDLLSNFQNFSLNQLVQAASTVMFNLNIFANDLRQTTASIQGLVDKNMEIMCPPSRFLKALGVRVSAANANEGQVNMDYMMANGYNPMGYSGYTMGYTSPNLYQGYYGGYQALMYPQLQNAGTMNYPYNGISNQGSFNQGSDAYNRGLQAGILAAMMQTKGQQSTMTGTQTQTNTNAMNNTGQTGMNNGMMQNTNGQQSTMTGTQNQTNTNTLNNTGQTAVNSGTMQNTNGQQSTMTGTQNQTNTNTTNNTGQTGMNNGMSQNTNGQQSSMTGTQNQTNALTNDPNAQNQNTYSPLNSPPGNNIFSQNQGDGLAQTNSQGIDSSNLSGGLAQNGMPVNDSNLSEYEQCVRSYR